jgi:hypothetical protein
MVSSPALLNKMKGGKTKGVSDEKSLRKTKASVVSKRGKQQKKEASSSAVPLPLRASARYSQFNLRALQLNSI